MGKAWMGRGDLISAMLAGVDADARNWRERDIERRANRVLLAKLGAEVAGLPTSVTRWFDLLPRLQRTHQVVTSAVHGSVNWVKTRELGMWPPSEVITVLHGPPERNPYWEALQYLAATLTDLISSVGLGEPTASTDEITALRALLTDDGIVNIPDAESLYGLRTEGWPWRQVAAAVEMIKAVQASPLDWAFECLLPDSTMAPRLFHLGVLGEVLLAAHAAGAVVESLGPLDSAGPSYRVKSPTGTSWDIWYEAAGVWGAYKATSAYVQLSAALGPAQPLSPDVLLRSDNLEIIIECKYSARQDTIRQGISQVFAYLMEHSHAWPTVIHRGVVVAPVGTVPSARSTRLGNGSVAVEDSTALYLWLCDVLLT